MSAIEDRDPVKKPVETKRSPDGRTAVGATFGTIRDGQSSGFRTDIRYRLGGGVIVYVSGRTPLPPSPSAGNRWVTREFHQGSVRSDISLQASEKAPVVREKDLAHHTVPQAPNGVDPSWVALGRELGFLPAWDDDAVLEYKDPTYPGEEGMTLGPVERVKVLRSKLADRGRSGVTVSMVVPRLPGDITDPIFAAKAYIIEVPDGFWSLDAAGRIEAYRELIPASDDVDDFPPLVPASSLAKRERVPGLYSDRNPDLTEEDVRDWRRRVSKSARSD